MGVEAFGRILTKVRSGNLDNVMSNLSNSASDEAKALQYVKDKFNKRSPFQRAYIRTAAERSEENGLVDVDPKHLSIDTPFPEVKDDQSYKKIFFANQKLDDMDFIESKKPVSFDDMLKRNNEDKFSYLSGHSFLKSGESSQVIEEMEEIGILESKVNYAEGFEDLLTDEDRNFLSNSKGREIYKNAINEVRTGKRSVSAEQLKQAEQDHFQDLAYNVNNFLFEPTEQESLALTKNVHTYTQDDYQALIQRRKKLNQPNSNLAFDSNSDPQLNEVKNYSFGSKDEISETIDDDFINAASRELDNNFSETNVVKKPQSIDEFPDDAYLNDDEVEYIKDYSATRDRLSEVHQESANMRPEDRDFLMRESPSDVIERARKRGVVNPNYQKSNQEEKISINANSDELDFNTDKTIELNESDILEKEYLNADGFVDDHSFKNDDIPGVDSNNSYTHSLPRRPFELQNMSKVKQPKSKPEVKPPPTEKDLAYEARAKVNPNFAKLNNIKDFDSFNDSESVSSLAFDRSVGGKNNRDIQMLKHELVGESRNNNPETVNQRIDFYKKQGVIDDKEAEPLKAFFNTNFENMDAQGVNGFFNQYNDNLSQNMTPRQARLAVNQKMDNKQEGFFSTNSEDNFKNFAGRSIIGGIAGAAIGTATDDNPEAGFVAGMVGASVGRNAASLLRNNTEMFEGKMINSLLKDSAKGKTRPQQLEAVESLDDEALDFMDKMYKDKLTKNFGTSNMFENSAVTGSRAMTLSGAALAGVAFTPKKRDHRRGFNANRGNRI